MADIVFRRSEQDDKLFDNADEMFDTVASIVKAPPVGYWKQPFTDPKVLIAVLTLMIGIVALLTELVKRGE